MNDEDQVIYTFDICYICWEMDTIGWVMQRPDGTRYIKGTNHGSPYIMEMDELQSLIDEAESRLIQLFKAKALL